MLNQALPNHYRDILDRAAEITRDAADRLEHFPNAKGEQARCIKLIRAAAVVIHGVLEQRSDRQFLAALQELMAARTVTDTVDATRGSR